MMPSTFVVNTTADSGPGSLRQAITSANAAPGSTIDFSIGTGVQVITPFSALPAITASVTIDGTSQPGYTGTPLIELVGSSAGAGASGLTFSGSSSGGGVEGLIINEFPSNGILITGSGWGIWNDYIGTDVASKIPEPNGAAGIEIDGGSNNTIGGTSSTPGTGLGDLISGNTNSGVYLDDTSDNLVEGNLIGTDVTGTLALGNSTSGVQIVGSSSNTVGGLSTSSRNIISGNITNGVVINGSGGASNNVIVGNFIGTNAGGTAAIGNNLGVGIWNGATDNTVGGTVAARNLISGNTSDGIDIWASGTSGNLIEGNDIGTNAAVTAGLGNASAGIAMYSGTTANTISGNVVSGNVYGIAVDGSGTSDNVLTSNLVGVAVIVGNMTSLPNSDGVLVQAGATDNTIGGATLASANVISGNTNSGLNIGNFGTSGNLVENNFIGTDAASDSGIGNDGGIRFFGDANGGPTDNTVGAGNVISGNSYVGISIYNTGTSDNLVAGNLIGTNDQGTAALPNGIGVLISTSASSNTIGGTTGAAANVISGNTTYGVELANSGTTGNVIAGDKIGTDITGTVALANHDGVFITSGASANTIGGLTATPGTGAGNIISGNTSVDVQVGALAGDPTTTDNVVAGNLIGTDVTGTAALGSDYGIWSTGVGTTIGGLSSTSRNIISGSIDGNVVVTGTGATNDLIAGNFIGLDVTGTTTVGDASGNITLDSSGNTIGGTATAARNVIAMPSGTEINLNYSGSTGNLVAGNFIGTDSSGTIDLAFGVDGITEQNGAAGNTIGGTVSGAGNLVVQSGAGTYAMLMISNNLIAGNLIDSNASNTAALGQTYGGITLTGSGNTVGGTVAAARNDLPTDGIWLQASAQHNLVEGNISGLDITGMIKLSSNSGIEVDGSNNTIGGTVPGSANVLAGLSSSGENAELELDGTYSTGNLVEGNLIGTDITGTISINSYAGIVVASGATGNTIGGTAAGAANVIASSAVGLEIDGSSPANLVLGNKIGTDITGTQALSNGTGVLVVSGANTIGGTTAGSGNVISGNAGSVGDPDNGYGIWLTGTTGGNLVEGNLIGLDATGENILGNTTNAGVFIDGGPGNTIGGTSPAAANVISGNYRGIFISSATATGNVVEGNLIGTDKTGTVALGNTHEGILIALATSNTIGGSTAGAGNVISGNATYGIEITDMSTGILVAGNLIGTDSAGTVALGNGLGGVVVSSAGNTIGGQVAGAGNVISGNNTSPDAGIEITGAGTSSNVVQGNLIGTDITGTTAFDGSGNPLGNFIGVEIDSGASGNTIGGTTTGSGNVVSGNTYDGVEITGSGSSGNLVEGDYIGTDITGTIAIDTNGKPLGNYTGLEIASGASNNTIGGSISGSGNVVSGNRASGVLIGGADNVVEGNKIGTDSTGTVAVANSAGIEFDLGGSGNTIGGLTAAPGSGVGNLISGNNGTGITDYGGANVIAGNLIGTAAGGSTALANASDGIDAYEGGDTIGGTAAGAGNVISGNDGYGIYDDGANLIAGNLIGTDVSGTFAVPNDYPGIYIWTSGSTIGGSTAAAGNVISGNIHGGIIVYASANLIEGNKVGTNSDGTADLANNSEGIILDAGSNTIGGLTATPGTGAGNLLTGNYGAGVSDSSSGDNLIEGNLVGTDASGTVALAYATDGIDISSDDTVGGTAARAGNVISGNGHYGIYVGGSGNLVAGNKIGTDITGTVAITNGVYGIGIGGGASGNTIGGTTAGAGNLISGNTRLRRRVDLRPPDRHHRQHGRRQSDRHRHHRHGDAAIANATTASRSIPGTPATRSAD